jgi:tetratricopeptide (TPR) repeat protein
MRWTLVLPLLLIPVAAEEPVDDGKAAWLQLRNDYYAARNDYYKVPREKRKDLEHPTPAYLLPVRAHAEKYAGKPGATPALIWILSNARDEEEKRRVLNTLLAAHIKDAQLAQATHRLRYMGDEGVDALRKIAKQSPHAAVRGRALLSLGQALKRAGKSDEALEIFKRVMKDFGVVIYYGKKTLATAAEGEIYELTALTEGMEAPDIQGSDQDGVAFKLSDYRGRVVFIDFWGDW